MSNFQSRSNPAANLKILEDLQKQKQAMKKQQTPSDMESSLPTNGNQSSSGPSQRERAALQHALQNSFGSFVSQDSSFGNLILPVLPRFN